MSEQIHFIIHKISTIQSVESMNLRQFQVNFINAAKAKMFIKWFPG